jgi:hypothetical protein
MNKTKQKQKQNTTKTKQKQNQNDLVAIVFALISFGEGV